MKKLLFLLIIIVGVLSINPTVNAEVIETSSGYIFIDAVFLRTTLMNQDPYPAEPGGYVDLLFKVENWGTKKAENVVFELLPEYPFTLDPGVNATRELGTIRGLETGERAYLLKYRLRVDKDAIDGESEIRLKYTYGTGLTAFVRPFNVTISNPRTDFDVVVQDLTATSTTLAIANIGANTGYSVIVRIPEQENFRATGISANIIGNLNAGDYTFVSFQIISTGRERNLVVEISYTDTLGIRRTIQKEVRLDTAGTMRTSETGTRMQRTQGSGFSILGGGSLTYIVIGILGIIAIVVFIKFGKRLKRKKK